MSRFTRDEQPVDHTASLYDDKTSTEKRNATAVAQFASLLEAVTDKQFQGRNAGVYIDTYWKATISIKVDIQG